MQTQLDGPLDPGPVLAHYAYVARYEYSAVVPQNDNYLRLWPYDDQYQTPAEEGCEVATVPEGQKVIYRDRLGNVVNRIRITAPHRELIIAAAGRVCLNDREPVADDVPLADVSYGPESSDFLMASPLADPASVRETANGAVGSATTLLETVNAVVRWVYENIRYERGNTSVRTSAAEILESRSGVCQDMTHLATAMLRARGVPARYVSGLLTRQPGETHAWLEFLHPQRGWLPADPTRGTTQLSGTDYLKFAVGRDYSEVPPVSGSFVSDGAGWLNFIMAKVFFDRESISLDDALSLLEGP